MISLIVLFMTYGSAINYNIYEHCMLCRILLKTHGCLSRGYCLININDVHYFYFSYKLHYLTSLFFSSKFDDIYDEDYFVNTLENDVRVVNKIPEYLMERFDHNLTNVYNFRVKAWSPIQYYGDAVLPKLLEEKWAWISCVSSLFIFKIFIINFFIFNVLS